MADHITGNIPPTGLLQACTNETCEVTMKNMESKIVYCKGRESAASPLSCLKLVQNQVSVGGVCCWVQLILDINVIIRNARLTPENRMIKFLQNKLNLKIPIHKTPVKM